MTAIIENRELLAKPGQLELSQTIRRLDDLADKGEVPVDILASVCSSSISRWSRCSLTTFAGLQSSVRVSKLRSLMLSALYLAKAQRWPRPWG